MKRRDWAMFALGILIAWIMFRTNISVHVVHDEVRVKNVERKLRQHDMHMEMIWGIIKREFPEIRNE